MFIVVAEAVVTQFKVNVGVLASNRVSAVAHFSLAFECTLLRESVLVFSSFPNVMNPLMLFT